MIETVKGPSGGPESEDKKMARTKKWGAFTVTLKTLELLDDAKGEVESLKDELEEWRDNMEGAGMENVPKFEEVSEAADLLDSAFDRLDEVQTDLVDKLWPEPEDGWKDGEEPTTEGTEWRARSMSRSARMGNAASLMNTLKEAVEARLEELREEHSDREDVVMESLMEERGVDTLSHDDPELADALHKEVPENELLEEVEQLVSEIDQAVDEMECVDFPGMF